MKKKVLALSMLLVITCFVQAHEFWLQPKKFRYALGEDIKLDFMVGESFTGEFWDLSIHKAERMNLYRVSGVSDLKGKIKPTEGNNLLFKTDQEGTYLFSLQSDAAYIGLEGEKFNEYLKDDGLDYILDERKRLNILEKPSKEFFSRYAKVLVQTGSKPDDTFKRTVGFRYEVTPVQNPYSLKVGDHLQCQISYEGKPAAHALVKVWNKVNNTTFLQNIYTETDGTIRFPISATGPWMVSSVRMIPSEKEGADYHSLWASLVFGIE